MNSNPNLNHEGTKITKKATELVSERMLRLRVLRVFVVHSPALVALLLACSLVSHAHAADLPAGAPVIESTVSPAAEPQPAMRYMFLPDVLEEKPGNAASLYYQAILQMQAADLMKGDDYKLLEMPVDRWLPERTQRLLNPDGPVKLIREATLRPDCDWGYPIREQGIYATLMVGLSEFRQLGRLVLIHARHAAANNETDETIRHVGTLLTMAHQQEQGQTLIQALVGVALADEALKTAGALIEQPNSPNLYWALSDLPQPLVSIRSAMRFERQMLFMSYPELDRVSAASTPAELEAVSGDLTNLLGRLPDLINQTDESGRTPRHQVREVLVAMALYPEARQWLVQQGFSDEKVAAMPVVQAVGLYTLSRYKHWRDEAFKYLSLPYHEAHARLKETEQALSRAASAEAFPMSQLLPSVSRAAFVSARLDRHVAMLRVIEAVRMHAAKHRQLPATLDDVTIVPVPEDPVTGRPFTYQLEGRTFTLTAATPQGSRPTDGVVYRVTVRPSLSPKD